MYGIMSRKEFLEYIWQASVKNKQRIKIAQNKCKQGENVLKFVKF